MCKLLLYIQVNPQYSQAIMVSRVVFRDSSAEPQLETVFGEQSVKLIQSPRINASNNFH